MALVLVVDDEPDIRLIARVVLTSAGHEVVEAASGEDALELLDERRPDAVLLDVRMPGMDGWQVLDRVRRQGPLPVVIFTANLSARSEAPGEWQEYEHLLVKPFSPDQLLHAVESAMASTAR